MPYLRFRLKLHDNFDNWISVFTLENEYKEFPFSEGEIVMMPLQVNLVELGPFVHEIQNAVWVAELFPHGEYVDQLEALRCQVFCSSDNRVHTLYGHADKDNYLVSHITATDGTIFPFNENDKVIMQLQVKKIYDSESASLGPFGHIAVGEAICEVEILSEEMITKAFKKTTISNENYRPTDRANTSLGSYVQLKLDTSTDE